MTSLTTKPIIYRLLLCLGLLVCLPVQAAYVTDKIVVEVYSQRLSQGAVLKTLSSGSSVEVLMTDGDYSRIRTTDNITGWIESRYLTNEKPTQAEYLALLTKTKDLETKLRAAEAKLANPAEGGIEGIDIAEIEELRKRAADAGWMRVELKKARDRVIEVENKLKVSGQASNYSQDELSKLQNQNKELEERLAAIMLINEEQTEGASSATQNSDEQGWVVTIGWFLGSIAVALIIGLIAGIILLDKRIRQRHGGFRIY